MLNREITEPEMYTLFDFFRLIHNERMYGAKFRPIFLDDILALLDSVNDNPYAPIETILKKIKELEVE